MSGAIKIGAQGLLSLGAGYGDIAAIVQHSRVVANWLRTSQLDNELFESIAEVYGEVLRRRGLVDTILMNQRWSAQWHFIYRGQIQHHSEDSLSSKDSELHGFSWLMVAIITALDVCLTSTEIRKLLTDVFVRVLDRDDVVELSKSLDIQLGTNIMAWRDSGCIRGLVNPAQAAMRERYNSLTGQGSVPQLNAVELEELTCLLVWLLSRDTESQHVLSAICVAVFEGLKVVGLQIDVGRQGDIFQGRPLVYYVESDTTETGLTERLEAHAPMAGSSTAIPPQKLSFKSINPAEMIEGFRCANVLKNAMSQCWQRGEDAARECKLECRADPHNPSRERRLVYAISSCSQNVSRWPNAVVTLAEWCCPVPNQALLCAVDELFGSEVDELRTWLGDNFHEHETPSMIGADIMDLTKSYPEHEIDRFLRYQALVHGFWYTLVGQIVSHEYLDSQIYLSTFWGWRDHRLLSVMFSYRIDFLKQNGLSRAQLLHFLGLMYAGRMVGGALKDRDLVGIIGSVSVIPRCLLKVSDNPDTIAKIAIVSLPILDLLPERNGNLYTSSTCSHSTFAEPPTPTDTCIESTRRSWSVHAQMQFDGGELGGVSMIARCDGRLIAIFNPTSAEVALIAARVPIDAHVKDGSSVDQNVSMTTIKAHKITEEMMYHSILAGHSKHKAPYVIQSRGSVALRFVAASFYGYPAVILRADETLSQGQTQLRNQQRPDGFIIC